MTKELYTAEICRSNETTNNSNGACNSLALETWAPRTRNQLSRQPFRAYEAFASQAMKPVPVIPNLLTTPPYNSAVKLNVQITDIPNDSANDTVNGAVADSSKREVSLIRGIQSIKDLQEYGTGIGIGLQNTASTTLQFLSQRNAVNNLLQNAGHQFAHAVDYYSKQPGRLLPDTGTTMNTIGQSAADNLGHPLSPRLAGEYTGQALTFFFPMGAGGRVLGEGEMAAYGGEGVLKALPEEELAALKLTRIEPDEEGLAMAAKVADLHLEPEVIADAIQNFERASEVSPEGLEQVGRYLRLFEHPQYPDKLMPKNEAMLNRLVNGERSSIDLCFYHHELVESKFVTDGCLDTREAHLKALRYQGITYTPGCDTELYHADVIRKNFSMFDLETVRKVFADL